MIQLIQNHLKMDSYKMTEKTVLHFEVTALTYTGDCIRGFFPVDKTTDIDCDDCLNIWIGSPTSGEVLQIRSGDVYTLKIKAIRAEDPKEPAQ